MSCEISPRKASARSASTSKRWPRRAGRSENSTVPSWPQILTRRRSPDPTSRSSWASICWPASVWGACIASSVRIGSTKARTTDSALWIASSVAESRTWSDTTSAVSREAPSTEPTTVATRTARGPSQEGRRTRRPRCGRSTDPVSGKPGAPSAMRHRPRGVAGLHHRLAREAGQGRGGPVPDGTIVTGMSGVVPGGAERSAAVERLRLRPDRQRVPGPDPAAGARPRPGRTRPRPGAGTRPRPGRTTTHRTLWPIATADRGWSRGRPRLCVRGPPVVVSPASPHTVRSHPVSAITFWPCALCQVGGAAVREPSHAWIRLAAAPRRGALSSAGPVQRAPRSGRGAAW